LLLDEDEDEEDEDDQREEDAGHWDGLNVGKLNVRRPRPLRRQLFNSATKVASVAVEEADRVGAEEAVAEDVEEEDRGWRHYRLTGAAP